jgi:hypothetical protein
MGSSNTSEIIIDNLESDITGRTSERGSVEWIE